MTKIATILLLRFMKQIILTYEYRLFCIDFKTSGLDLEVKTK